MSSTDPPVDAVNVVLPVAPPVRQPEFVIGYHGCSRRVAEIILTGSGFLPSENVYDWLGRGIYFWEYAPYRALDWAIQQTAASGEEPAVVGATIRLGRCLNLLDTPKMDGLKAAFDALTAAIGADSLPRNSGRAHNLDNATINLYCQNIIDAHCH